MPDRTDISACVYRCENSLIGVLCCIFESYTRREIPMQILETDEPTFFPAREIVSDELHAARVWRSLVKLGGEAADWCVDASLSCKAGWLETVYRFIRVCYAHGARATMMFADEAVDAIFKLVRGMRNEAHYYKEFLRFSDYNGALISVIEPDALVLEHIRQHYAERFPEETFLIFDKTHGLALFYRPYEWVIRPVESLELPPAGETEQAFRALWLRYYDAVGIEGRFNPDCRRGHMPKHYWKHMTERALLERSCDSSYLTEKAAGHRFGQMPAHTPTLPSGSNCISD